MRRFIFLLCAGTGLAFTLYAQDFSTYQSRKQWLLDSQKEVSLVGWGKHGVPRAVARLHKNPHDQEALAYLSNVLDNREQTMFDHPGMAMALCKYWDSFSPEQLSHIKARLEYLAKPEPNTGQGFLGHGTENHATVMWTGAYLYAQQFPDAKWRNGKTSKEQMADAKEWLRQAFKGYYEHGNSEYLSTTYEWTINFPVYVLLECAKDPEMKTIAEAFLLYRWSLISLNQFEGTVLAPFGRMNTQQDHQPDNSYVAVLTFYNWLMWGWGEATGNLRLSNLNMNPEYNEAIFVLYAAFSNVIPDEVFFRLAGLQQPFGLKSSASFFGHYGAGVPHMMMRKIYRSKGYAIGTGNFRWIPGGDGADHDSDGFIIAWPSADRFNYIGCYHPYWYSDGDVPDRTPDTWYRGNISPFQQTALHKNTAIVLFDIPDKDPWPDKPAPEKWAWRDGHANNLLKRGMLRYPGSIDEKIEENGWIFLREGKTYIGIKPLKSYYIQTGLTGKGLDGFHIVKSDHAKTGFIFELGTEEESGSFDKFRKNLPKNKLSVDWDKMTVSYTNSGKDKLQIHYVAGLHEVAVPEELRPDYWPRIGCTSLAESIPVVTINGKKEPSYEQWPMIESPYVNMDNSVLSIDDGQTKITVDWTGKLPKISRTK
jgi:hypothetical protein